MRRPTAACIALLALAACGSAEGKKAEAQMDPGALPPGETFEVSPSAVETVRSIEPMSNTATAITGAATFAPNTYSFALGQRYVVEPEETVGADVKWSAGGGAWADLLGVDKGGEIEVVRVTDQTIDPAKARNGSLCGSAKVRWIAVGRTADDVGAEVVMAAFSGARPPGPDGRDEDLCGTFSYASGN